MFSTKQACSHWILNRNQWKHKRWAAAAERKKSLILKASKCVKDLWQFCWIMEKVILDQFFVCAQFQCFYSASKCWIYDFLRYRKVFLWHQLIEEILKVMLKNNIKKKKKKKNISRAFHENNNGANNSKHYQVNFFSFVKLTDELKQCMKSLPVRIFNQNSIK